MELSPVVGSGLGVATAPGAVVAVGLDECMGLGVADGETVLGTTWWPIARGTEGGPAMVAAPSTGAGVASTTTGSCPLMGATTLRITSMKPRNHSPNSTTFFVCCILHLCKR